MKIILKCFSFVTFFALTSVVLFNKKVSVNNQQANTDLIAESFSLNNLNCNDFKKIDVKGLDTFEGGEEDSKDFFIIFKNKNVNLKKDIDFDKGFNAHPFSSEQKRYYILYCQLRIHS